MLGAQLEWYCYQNRNFPGDFFKGCVISESSGNGVPTLVIPGPGEVVWKVQISGPEFSLIIGVVRDRTPKETLKTFKEV